MWFPKPKSPADIEMLSPGANFSENSLFELLHDSKAVEWKEKVGVMTPADGSAKMSARLLHSRNWVFKTDLAQKTAEKQVLRTQLEQLTALAARVPLWHPDKLWFLVRIDHDWLPMSVCPQLMTIRKIDDWDTRIRWWSRMIVMGLELSQRYKIGLDLNPSNFAFDDPLSDLLYYLDDEFYAEHHCFDIAEAVVSRLPEDPKILPEQWRQWGTQIRSVVRPLCQEHEQWRHFLDGILAYPLTAALEPQRDALLKGLREELAAFGESAAIQTNPLEAKLTCILGDVHANLPAFEAVLKEAENLNVDSYLFVGDIVSYGPFPRQCLERLAELKNIVCIRGNHDHSSGSGIPENGSNRIAREVDMWTHKQLLQSEREWLLSLPTEHRSTPWLSVHGAPQDPHRFYAYVYELTYGDNLSYLEQHGFSVCFYGHTHVQFVYRRFASGEDEKTAPERIHVFQPQERLLINPGSVGQPRDGDPRAAFALWEREQNVVTFFRVPYSIDTTVEAIKKEGLPEDLIYRLEFGR